MLHPHLRDIVPQIPNIDEEADILIILVLIDHDLIDAHLLLEQKTGFPGSPFVQRIGLGWVVMGEALEGGSQYPINYFEKIPHIHKYPLNSESIVSHIPKIDPSIPHPYK